MCKQPYNSNKLSFYIPAICWTVVIFVFSTPNFSAQTTGGFLEFLVNQIWPDLSPWLDFFHLMIRKLAHLSAYGILSWCWFRAFFKGFELEINESLFKVFFLCLLIACLDEGHQALRASRTGSLLDIIIDMCGASLVLLSLKRIWSNNSI